ncbi:MAG: hypothetical protein AB7Q81_18945 [Gammaproteobacteria bacterium]
MKRLSRAVGTAIVLTLATSAHANPIIFDNMAVVDFGFGSDYDFGGGQFIADDFTLQAGANTITDIHWTGFYGTADTPLANDDFDIFIYADAGGIPDVGNVVLSLTGITNANRTDTGIDVSVGIPFDLYAYAIDITPLTLTANTTYWLSIVNDTTADLDDWWAWGTDSQGSGIASSNNQVTWNVSTRAADFQLTGQAIPEPAGVALLTLGIAGLRRGRRRHRA